MKTLARFAALLVLLLLAAGLQAQVPLWYTQGDSLKATIIKQWLTFGKVTLNRNGGIYSSGTLLPFSIPGTSTVKYRFENDTSYFQGDTAAFNHFIGDGAGITGVLHPSDTTALLLGKTRAAQIYQPVGMGYLVPSDTGSLVLGKTRATQIYQPVGSYLVPSDTGSLVGSKNFLTNQYQPKGSYLVPSDTGSLVGSKNFLTNQYQPKGSYLVPSDTGSLVGSKNFLTNQYQPKGSYLVPSDTGSLVLGKTRATQIYQSIVPNLGDTTKYVEGLDSLKASGYFTNEKARVDSTERNSLIAKKVAKADTSTLVASGTVSGFYPYTRWVRADTGAFTTTGTRVALYEPGTKAPSYWVATPRGQTDALPVAGDLIRVWVKTDSVILTRPASGTSGLKFTILGIF